MFNLYKAAILISASIIIALIKHSSGTLVCNFKSVYFEKTSTCVFVAHMGWSFKYSKDKLFELVSQSMGIPEDPVYSCVDIKSHNESSALTVDISPLSTEKDLFMPESESYCLKISFKFLSSKIANLTASEQKFNVNYKDIMLGIPESINRHDLWEQIPRDIWMDLVLPIDIQSGTTNSTNNSSQLLNRLHIKASNGTCVKSISAQLNDSCSTGLFMHFHNSTQMLLLDVPSETTTTVTTNATSTTVTSTTTTTASTNISIIESGRIGGRPKVQVLHWRLDRHILLMASIGTCFFLMFALTCALSFIFGKRHTRRAIRNCGIQDCSHKLLPALNGDLTTMVPEQALVVRRDQTNVDRARPKSAVMSRAIETVVVETNMSANAVQMNQSRLSIVNDSSINSDVLKNTATQLETSDSHPQLFRRRQNPADSGNESEVSSVVCQPQTSAVVRCKGNQEYSLLSEVSVGNSASSATKQSLRSLANAVSKTPYYNDHGSSSLASHGATALDTSLVSVSQATEGGAGEETGSCSSSRRNLPSHPASARIDRAIPAALSKKRHSLVLALNENNALVLQARGTIPEVEQENQTLDEVSMNNCLTSTLSITAGSSRDCHSSSEYIPIHTSCDMQSTCTQIVTEFEHDDESSPPPDYEDAVRWLNKQQDVDSNLQ